MTIHQFVKGILGITKSTLNINTNDKLAIKRLSICYECDSVDKNKSKCTECGCVLSFKTRLEDEKCPLNKW